jgi:hypothetical protein
MKKSGESHSSFLTDCLLMKSHTAALSGGM